MITLIENKVKDKRFLKNWRPISLIDVDAKVASKSLALRVRKVLNSFIHNDQTAYLKDRYIGESVRLISDILEYTNDNDIEAILCRYQFDQLPSPRANPWVTNFFRQNPRPGDSFSVKNSGPRFEKSKQKSPSLDITCLG